MLSFLSGILGKGDTVEKGLDMAGKGLDAMFFTNEEKSVANQTILDWKLKWISATGAQSVARRVIAYVIVALWAYIVMLAVHFHILGFVKEAEFLFKVLADVLNWPFIAVMSFYYYAHVVRNKK
jgi:hypothetical protein